MQIDDSGQTQKNIFPYFAFIVIGLSLLSKILQKEKQLRRWILLQELVVRLNYILQYDIQHYTHQLLNGSSSTKSFIFWFLQNIGKEYCTKKINNKKYIPERLHKT